MAIDHVVRQAEGPRRTRALVLEKSRSGSSSFRPQRLGQAADVVVALDGVRLLVLARRRTRSRRVDGALGQPRALAFGSFLLRLKHLDELAADDLALLLGVGDALQVCP